MMSPSERWSAVAAVRAHLAERKAVLSEPIDNVIAQLVDEYAAVGAEA